MSGDFYIVKKSVLPDYFGKVLEAKELLRSGEAKEISEAVKLAGISRSTYYKYKDAVFSAGDGAGGSRALFSVMLSHKPGILGKVLNYLSECGANVLTINQNQPIGSKASVIIMIDSSGLNLELSDMIKGLGGLGGVSKPTLIDIR